MRLHPYPPQKYSFLSEGESSQDPDIRKFTAICVARLQAPLVLALVRLGWVDQRMAIKVLNSLK